MTNTNNLATYIQDLIDAWKSYDLERVLPYYAEAYEAADIGQPHIQHGRNAVKEMLLRYWKAFPDLRFRVESTVVKQNRIAVAWCAVGTHQGPMMNVPATGYKVEVRGISIIEVEAGVITRGQSIWDMAGMLRHMGLLPEL